MVNHWRSSKGVPCEGTLNYRRAVCKRKELERMGIGPGSRVDICNGRAEGRDKWIGPYVVSKIVSGGNVSIKGRKGHFNSMSIRLHAEDDCTPPG